eukprot:scaffold34369_cov71-Isochrysis_galbana.AAC.1
MYLYDAAAHRVSAARAATLASVRSHLADTGAAAPPSKCSSLSGAAREQGVLRAQHRWMQPGFDARRDL